jgi:ribosomal protein S18 acetylase RimI-like enzyme
VIELSNVDFLPYDDERHWNNYLDMGIEYAHWLNGQVLKHYGVPLFQNTKPENFMEERAKAWTSIQPPEGIIIILEVDGKVGGMGRIDKFNDTTTEAHNIWTFPKYRGNGYATRIMLKLEQKAKEFGFNYIRLDTARFNVPAQGLYKKLGYSEIEKYSQTRFPNESLKRYYNEKIYMEKKL